LAQKKFPLKTKMVRVNNIISSAAAVPVVQKQQTAKAPVPNNQTSKKATVVPAAVQAKPPGTNAWAAVPVPIKPAAVEQPSVSFFLDIITFPLWHVYCVLKRNWYCPAKTNNF
jgi:hypothetical protein